MLRKRTAENMWTKNREEVRGGCRELHNKELHNFYFLPNIRMIKLRVIWTGHMAVTQLHIQNFGWKIGT